MREAVTYQAILDEERAGGREEGRAQQAHDILQELGSRRFGSPSPQVQSRVEKASVSELKALVRRLLDVESWDDLLATDEAA